MVAEIWKSILHRLHYLHTLTFWGTRFLVWIRLLQHLLSLCFEINDSGQAKNGLRRTSTWILLPGGCEAPPSEQSDFLPMWHIHCNKATQWTFYRANGSNFIPSGRYGRLKFCNDHDDLEMAINSSFIKSFFGYSDLCDVASLEESGQKNWRTGVKYLNFEHRSALGKANVQG